MQRPHERFAYSGMPERPPLALPDKARIAVYLVVNVEEWDIEKPVAREYVTAPAGVATVPNIPNWSWHEYGMRVGIWRIIEVLQKRHKRATAAVNARVCLGAGEPVAKAMLDAGWGFMGHGFSQTPMHVVDKQQHAIEQTYTTLKAYTGSAPKGWLGPGLHETLDTLDYLSQTGFKYVCDWPLDEHPVVMRTSAEPIIAMPYTLELSDLPMMVVHQHESAVWLQRVKDQFDQLYEEGAEQPRIMSMSIHPYIMGVPHRIKYFAAAYDYMMSKADVWFTTADEIYDWYAGQVNTDLAS